MSLENFHLLATSRKTAKYRVTSVVSFNDVNRIFTFILRQVEVFFFLT